MEAALAPLFALTGNWTWLIIAVILLVLELVAPAMFFLWLGVAAIVVGVISFFVDWSWQWQIGTFATLSVVGVVASRYFFASKKGETDRPLLNKRSKQLIGRIFILTVAIQNGRGRAQVGDGSWAVEGPDAPNGTRVKVHGARDNVLLVKIVESK
ncbi:MAG: NfeD family protein [Alphaproteobacteria bacterium]